MVAAVLFDLDETLLDRTASVKAFLADQYARFAAVLDSIPLDVYRDRFMALDARGSVPKSVVYPTLLAELGRPAEAASALLDDYRANSCRYARAMAGMDDLLKVLRARGLKLGIISNGEAALQWSTIDALGLRDRMDAVLVSEAEGLRKPEPALFQRAAQRLGVAPADCLFIGDNPVADVLGARHAGMAAVWLDNGLPWPRGVPKGPTVHGLAELLPLIV